MGVRNNNLLFLEYQMARWADVFSYARKNNIGVMIHGGDFFDNRNAISMPVIQAVSVEFSQMLQKSGMEFHEIVGNHDVAYKNDNTLNSPNMLVEGAKVYWEKPQTVLFGGVAVDLIPWINNANYDDTVKFIESSKSEICIGHFEISGAPFHKGGIACEGGMSASLFSKYKKVLSGHFHTRSKIGNVEYIGAAFDYTWADWNDPRGFVVLDLDTLEMEYVDWSTFMFVMGSMDEEGNVDFYPPCDNISGKFVRIACEHDSNKKIEKALSALEAQEPAGFEVFFSVAKDVNSTTVDLESLANETAVITAVVEESISDEELRNDVNAWLQMLHHEVSVR